jgi:hypothetical protein
MGYRAAMSSLDHVSPDELVPPIGASLWPEMVPHHGVTIVAGLRPDGGETLHIACSTDTPPWVLVGMLKLAVADLVAATSGVYGDED